MTGVAASSEVTQAKPQFRANLDPDLMVRMQVTLIAREPPTKFLTNHAGRWWINPTLATLADDVRLPAAVDAPPLVQSLRADQLTGCAWYSRDGHSSRKAPTLSYMHFAEQVLLQELSGPAARALPPPLAFVGCAPFSNRVSCSQQRR